MTPTANTSRIAPRWPSSDWRPAVDSVSVCVGVIVGALWVGVDDAAVGAGVAVGVGVGVAIGVATSVVGVTDALSSEVSELSGIRRRSRRLGCGRVFIAAGVRRRCRFLSDSKHSTLCF